MGTTNGLIQKCFGLIGSRNDMWPATPSSKPKSANTRNAAARCSLQYFCFSSGVLKSGMVGTVILPSLVCTPTAMDFTSPPFLEKMVDLGSLSTPCEIVSVAMGAILKEVPSARSRELYRELYNQGPRDVRRYRALKLMSVGVLHGQREAPHVALIYSSCIAGRPRRPRRLGGHSGPRSVCCFGMCRRAVCDEQPEQPRPVAFPPTKSGVGWRTVRGNVPHQSGPTPSGSGPRSV